MAALNRRFSGFFGGTRAPATTALLIANILIFGIMTWFSRYKLARAAACGFSLVSMEKFFTGLAPCGHQPLCMASLIAW